MNDIMTESEKQTMQLEEINKRLDRLIDAIIKLLGSMEMVGAQPITRLEPFSFFPDDTVVKY